MKVIVIAGGVVVLSAIAAIAIFLGTRSPKSSSEPPAPPLTAARAEQLGSDVSSGDPARVRRALAMPTGVVLDPAAVGALAKMTITVDVASFAAVDAQTATVNGTVSEAGGSARPVRFTLVLTDGQWQLVSAGAPS